MFHSGSSRARSRSVVGDYLAPLGERAILTSFAVTEVRSMLSPEESVAALVFSADGDQRSSGMGTDVLQARGGEAAHCAASCPREIISLCTAVDGV